MKEAKDVIPWKLTDISIRPYDGFWSMNPSIHFDGDLWRCVLRCCDYAMPDGTTIRSQKARVAGQMTKNAMVIFDPASWKPAKIFKMQENDDHPRVACPNYGYEDMRIFRTDKGGLQGIAASLHLRRETQKGIVEKGSSLGTQHQPPEQVLLSFDAEYHIVAACPIRGDSWSGSPQKNWVPFDHATEPRFLYSIGKATMFGENGSLHGEHAIAHPSSRTTVASAVAQDSVPSEPQRSPDEVREPQRMPEAAADRHDRPHKKKHPKVRGGDVRIMRGGRMALDASASRPSARPSARSSMKQHTAKHHGNHGNDSTRLMGSGRILMPRYEGLRGGSQLVRVGDEGWLGLAHEMKFVSGKKFYWHTWYLVDARGKMKAASEPMKLAPGGIEFAAGLAITGDRIVVSFGVDDMECWIGETRLSAVLEILRPIDR